MTQEFSFGFQYAFTPNDVLDVNYVGGRGRRITLGGMNYGQLNPSYLSMGSALTSGCAHEPLCHRLEPAWALLLRAARNGGAILDAVSGVLRKRLSPGRTGRKQQLQRIAGKLQASFRRRPDLYCLLHLLEVPVRTGGPEEWGSINGDHGGSSIRNYYDLKADWSVDGDDIPNPLVLNYVYDLPFGRGKKLGGGMNGVEDAIVGGWEVSGITTVQSGFPMSIGPNAEQLRSFLAAVSMQT